MALYEFRMDRMEMSAHVGLVALAVSDMLYCIVHLCTIIVPLKVVSQIHFSTRYPARARLRRLLYT